MSLRTGRVEDEDVCREERTVLAARTRREDASRITDAAGTQPAEIKSGRAAYATSAPGVSDWHRPKLV